ncbi:MAG: glucose-6-phosphate dehydrogenase assembly protein OpcA [Simkaniaceae bacterium]|nr:glucose-6-phosphate dehydrogenase assembly protein OpcA [Candidatus Sacchlamyda saccharinae]
MTTDIIPPSEIRSELIRLWETLESSNKVRASLFNLIFYTKKKLRAEYIREISQKVLEKFPSRVIFISSDAEGDHLNTRVSVVPVNEKESDIACDFIQIDVAGTQAEKVPFVMLPHIVPDLPVYVIWAEDPQTPSPLFDEVKKLADRIIFDSEAISDLSTFAKNLLEIAETPQLNIADLNWARMESWRDLMASTFYTEKRLNLLRKTSKIQILYNAKESTYTCHTQIQALYLQGWLACQLGWSLTKANQENGKYTLTYAREGGEVEIHLYPEEHDNIKAGDIISVDLETEDQHHFSFGRNLDLPHHISMRLSTLEKCDIPLKYIFAKDESGGSLVKEICHKGTSKHFLNLLKQIQNRKEFSHCEH